MTLPIIRSGGIEAYCSDLVIDENTWAYLLSVAGYQTAVKGINNGDNTTFVHVRLLSARAFL